MNHLRKPARLIAALTLTLLLFSACTARDAASASTDEASAAQSASSALSGIHSGTSVSSSYIDPNRPAADMFIPEAPAGSVVYHEPETRTTSMSPFLQTKTIPAFDGAAYSLRNYFLHAELRSVLYSSDDAFFVLENTLYHYDVSGISFIMDRVYDIAGCDKDGLYLIVADAGAPDLQNEYTKGPAQASLTHYHPVTGKLTSIVSNVQAAIVSKSKDVLFYATAQAEDNEFGYRYVVKRRKLPWGSDSLVFTDDYVASFGFPEDSKDDQYAALRVEFYFEDEMIGATFEYPFGSEFPYERHLWFKTDGQIVADSEKEEVLFEDEMLTTGIYKDSYEHYVPDDPVPLGPYQIRVVIEDSGFRSFMVVHDGKELYWEWRTGLDIFQADDLLYSSNSIYNGEYSYILPFDLSFWEYPLKINNQVYYFVSSHDEGMDKMLLYKSTGTKTDPLSFDIMGGLAAERTDDFYLGMYWSSIYTAGDFIFIIGREDNMMVIDTLTESVTTAGTEQVSCLLPA